MKILNFGSLNLDNTYIVDHFVQPGETMTSIRLENACGGKGTNQSIALAKAGAEVYHAGRIGTDGGVLRDLLNANGVDTRFLKTVDNEKTGHAIIQVNQEGQNCIILYKGSNYSFTNDDVDEILSAFEPGDIMILQNETSCVEYAIEAAAKRGLKVALNPSPMTPELAASPAMKYVTWFILNELEGAAIAGKEKGADICAELLAKFPGCKVMLTLGKDGCVYSDGEQTIRHGIFKVKAVDTTAAGDTFAGFFLGGVAQGKPMEEILRTASKASAIAVSRPGAAPSIPTLEEVMNTELELNPDYDPNR